MRIALVAAESSGSRLSALDFNAMHELYENPLISRYASSEMATLWGDQRKFSTWRRLWVLLAEAEAELGLPISRQQIQELRSRVDDINFETAENYERQAATRRDGACACLRRSMPNGRRSFI